MTLNGMSATSNSMIVDGKVIGAGNRPYVIAEMSGNHNGDIGRAFAILEAAHECGADAIKLQTYTADTITIDHGGPEFQVDLPLWKNRSLYDLYEEAHTPWEWHAPLFKKAAELGLTILSSPFDFTAVDFLEDLGCPAYKIASPELVDIPLIRKVASTGKPMIMSTGMGSLEEIDDAVRAAREGGCDELCLLHCVSAYPTPPEDAYLMNIEELSQRFDVISGLSDHSHGITIPVAAVALGASVIEKHFTLSRADGGVDSAFSLEPDELKEMIDSVRACSAACGSKARFGPKSSEMANVAYRRSLYAVEDIAEGDVFTPDNVRSIRPGLGLKPKYHDVLIGRQAGCHISRGTPMSWSVVKGGEEE